MLRADQKEDGSVWKWIDLKAKRKSEKEEAEKAAQEEAERAAEEQLLADSAEIGWEIAIEAEEEAAEKVTVTDQVNESSEEGLSEEPSALLALPSYLFSVF